MYLSIHGKVHALVTRASDWFFSWSGFPAWLFLLYLILFGVWIPFLGFYWDDWPHSFLARNFGPEGIFRYFIDERPLAGWTFMLFSPLLGGSIIGWHVLSLVLRFGSVLAVWWFLKTLWPKRAAEASLAALVFAIYPVFSQQAQSITYHQLWTQFLLFFLSLGWTVLSIRQPEHCLRNTILSVLALYLNLSITEYFYAVELTRPFVIWLALAGHNSSIKSRLKQAAWHWLPYLVCFGLWIGGWLYYLQHHQFTTFQFGERIGAPNRPVLLAELLKNPIQSIIKLVQMALQDSVYVLFSSWSANLTPQLIQLDRPVLIGYWLLSVLTGVGISFILLRTSRKQDETNPPPASWTVCALALGLAIALLGAVPAWVTGRQSIKGMFDNRFAAISMVGAGLIIAATVRWGISRWKPLVLVFGVLTMLASGFHFRNADVYRQSWKSQTRMYWQMKWRAPSIHPNTLIITNGDVFDFMVTSSESFAINQLFNQPGQNNERLAYWTFAINHREMDRLPFVQGEESYQWAYRHFSFQSRKEDSLLIYYHPPDTKCYWFLSPEDADLPNLPQQVTQLLPISNLSRIDTRPHSENPPAETFGSSPDHGWCYYYEKASLARQKADWAAVVQLYHQARAAGYRPGEGESDVPFEWLPFIEGLSRSVQTDEAIQVTQHIFDKDPRYQKPICRVWQKISADPKPITQQAVVQARELLGCSTNGG